MPNRARRHAWARRGRGGEEVERFRVRDGQRVRKRDVRRRREARGVQELALESEDAGAERDVCRFGEVVGLRVDCGRGRRGRGRSVSGRRDSRPRDDEVRVDVCDAAEGARGGGYLGCEVDGGGGDVLRGPGKTGKLARLDEDVNFSEGCDEWGMDGWMDRCDGDGLS